MYASELAHGDKLRILIRVNYGYYVVERVLMNCHDSRLNEQLRSEICKNLCYLGGNALKNKWLDLVDKSARGYFNNKNFK